MKRFFLLLFVLKSFFTCAQVPFEHTYGEFYFHEYLFEAYQSPDSSYTALGLYDFDSLTLLKFSPSGNLIKDHKISLTNTTSYYYMYRYDENNYLVTEAGDIRKIDSSGNQLWFKSYIANNINARLNSTHDSSFVSLGNVAGSRDSVFTILKFDSSATLIESDTVYPDPAYTYFPMFIKELADGNYIACLERYMDTIPLGKDLFRVDTMGTILWNTLLPDNSISIKDVIATKDSGFLIGGVKPLGVGIMPLALMKFDATNQLQLDSTYILSMGIYRYQIEPTRDGGIIIGCDINIGTDLMITKFDSSYNLQWTRSFGGPDFDDFGSVRQTLDGGYILCGSRYIPGNNNDYYLIKTDSLGIVDTLFTSTFSHNIQPENFVFPNPTTGKLTLNLHKTDLSSIEIHNLVGEKVFYVQHPVSPTIDCSFLKPGIYFLQLSDKENLSRIKFIKN